MFLCKQVLPFPQVSRNPVFNCVSIARRWNNKTSIFFLSFHEAYRIWGFLQISGAFSENFGQRLVMWNPEESGKNVNVFLLVLKMIFFVALFIPSEYDLFCSTVAKNNRYFSRLNIETLSGFPLLEIKAAASTFSALLVSSGTQTFMLQSDWPTQP